MVRRNLIASYVASALVAGAGVTATHTLAAADAPPVAAPSTTAAAHRATPVTVVQETFVDDVTYVSTPDTVPAAPVETAPAPAPSTTGTRAAAVMSVSPSEGDHAESEQPRSNDSSPGWSPPPSTRPPAASTTTAPPSTTSPPATTPTTTWPPGTQLPRDWPPGKPYPPIPPGCTRPHLEDNGVWNCEH